MADRADILELDRARAATAARPASAPGRAQGRRCGPALEGGEAAPAEPQRLLRLALEAGRQLAWEVDLPSGAMRCEAPPGGWLGWAPEELGWATGGWLGLAHPEEAAALRERQAAFEREPTAARLFGEHRLRRRDGSYAWVACHTVAPVRGPDGRALRLAGIATDIDDRKTAELRLQDRERRLALALRGAGLGLWEIDFANQTITLNEEMAQRAGLAAGALTLTRERFLDLAHPSDRPLVAGIEAALRSGERAAAGGEFRLRRPDGSHYWAEILGSVVDRDERGRVTGAIGVSADITARKESESRLRRSEAEARARLEELAALYDEAPIGLLLLDARFQVLRANKRLTEMVGRPLEAQIGRPLREAAPALWAASEPHLRQALATGEPAHDIERALADPAAGPGGAGRSRRRCGRRRRGRRGRWPTSRPISTSSTARSRACCSAATAAPTGFWPSIASRPPRRSISAFRRPRSCGTAASSSRASIPRTGPPSGAGSRARCGPGPRRCGPCIVPWAATGAGAGCR